MSHRQNLATAKYIAGFLGLSTVYTALTLRSKQLKRLSDEGRRPVVLPRELPGHFLMALRHKRPTDIDELSQLSGLWVAFYTTPAVVQLTGSAGSLHAQHLTGNAMVPAGSQAFAVHADLRPDSLHGRCTASLLPGGLLLLQLPCLVTAYRDADEAAAAASAPAEAAGEEVSVLTVDCQLASWLPWLRVPLRRVPSSAYVSRDAHGLVRGDGVAEAVRAVTEVRPD